MINNEDKMNEETGKSTVVTIEDIENKIKELETEEENLLSAYIPSDYGRTARARITRLQQIKADKKTLSRVIELLAEEDDIKAFSTTQPLQSPAFLPSR
jgi:hypothetical protein